MDAYRILINASDVTGWDVDSMLVVACEYIDNQMAPDAFQDYVLQCVKEEQSMEEEEL